MPRHRLFRHPASPSSSAILAIEPSRAEAFLRRCDEEPDLSATFDRMRAGNYDGFELASEIRPGVYDNCGLELIYPAGLAILTIDGMLSPHYGWWALDPRAIVCHMENFLLDEQIHTVVLNINSPGGHVTGVSEAAAAIRAVAEAGKTVIAWTDVMAASAGYWLAAAADAIFATPSADIGSVGVFSYLLDFSGYFERQGLAARVFRDGDLKGIGALGKPLEDQEAEYLQQQVDEISTTFKGFVRARRPGVKGDALRGQTLSGAAGVAAGLANRTLPSWTALMAMLGRVD